MKYVLYIAAFFLSYTCKAQSYYDAAYAYAKIDSMYMLTVTSPATISFNSAYDYASAKTISGFATISIKCNYNWQISVRAATANFTALGGGASTNMPCSVLKIKPSTSSGYMILSTGEQTLASGNRGAASSPGNTFVIDAELNPGYSYNGGTYSLVLTYTVTRQ